MLNYLNVLLNHFAIKRTMNWKLRFILSQLDKCQSRRALLLFSGATDPQSCSSLRKDTCRGWSHPTTGRMLSSYIDLACYESCPRELSLTWYTHVIKWATSGSHKQVTTVERDLSNKSWQMLTAQSEHREGCPGFRLPCRLLLYHACSSLFHTTEETSLSRLAFSCYSTYFLISTINKLPVDHNMSVFSLTTLLNPQKTECPCVTS